MSINRFNPTLCRGRVWGVINVARASQRGLTWALGSSWNATTNRENGRLKTVSTLTRNFAVESVIVHFVLRHWSKMRHVHG